MGNYYNGGPKIFLVKNSQQRRGHYSRNGGKIWVLQPGTAGFFED
jgi:hypothetical protein